MRRIVEITVLGVLFFFLFTGLAYKTMTTMADIKTKMPPHEILTLADIK